MLRYQPNNQITNFQPSLYNPALPASDACNGLWTRGGHRSLRCGECAVRNQFQFWNSWSGPLAGQQQQPPDCSPRLGIAWDPWGDGNTAIRIGAGEFFQRERVSRYTLVANAPFAVTASYHPCLWIGGAAVLESGCSTGRWYGSERDIVPESWQWNVSIQRSLARDTTLELGYVGNHAYHQTSSYDLNQIAPQNWLAASFMTAAQNQAAGFFAFNNYSSNADLVDSPGRCRPTTRCRRCSRRVTRDRS